jgi:glyoxylase-like metal-dependent hydrolase (beta-lactamase superfamily II)
VNDARWTWRLLRAGGLWLDGGGMFGVVPKALWAKRTEVDDSNRIPLQTNCLLLEREGRRVLVETGFGDKWNERERSIFALEHRSVLTALDEIDVEPASIEHVVVSHLHFDHAAGLTRHEERLDLESPVVPSFPNAEVIVQRREWEDALANRSTMTRTYLRSHLAPIEDRLRLVDGEADILPGLSVFPVPGHTWGQQAVRFTGDEGVVCFPGDVMPTANHAGLAWSMGYDMEPYTNMSTKGELLRRASEEGWRIVIDHEPGEAVVRVAAHAQKPGRFVLEAVE